MKVVCISNTWFARMGSGDQVSGPIKGEIYTMIGESPKLRGYIELAEFPLTYWDESGFRPIDEQYGENIAGRIEQEIEEEELQEA